MKKKEIDIGGLIVFKTLNYAPKFNNFFFNNFIAKEEENVDSHFSFTIMNALISLTDICREQQGLSLDNIEGEFVRYDNYILVNELLVDFVEKNLNDGYYRDFLLPIVPEFTIIEQDVPDNFVYIVENNNCIKINIER
jgi:hypothetical protein